MKTTTIKALALMSHVNAYTAEGAALKNLMHSRGRVLLRSLADDLDMPTGSYDIRSNKGGIAVSGEVTLHHDRLYVQLSASCVGSRGVGVLYRSCTGREDYYGGANHFISTERLCDEFCAGAFVRRCKALMA